MGILLKKDCSYSSLDAIKPNSQHLMLSVDENSQLLKTIEKLGTAEKSLMVWALSNLKVRLQEKHPEFLGKSRNENDIRSRAL